MRNAKCKLEKRKHQTNREKWIKGEEFFEVHFALTILHFALCIVP